MAKTTGRQATRASRAQSYFPVKIPVYSLSGGVGRQIPSKRLPTEVDELINFQCTTESSLTKRNGAEVVGNLIVGISDLQDDGTDIEFDLNNWFVSSVPEKFFIYWQTVDTEISRLYTIWEGDPWLGSENHHKIKVFEITLSGSITELPYNNLDEDSVNYLMYKIPGTGKTLQQRLKAVTIGSSVLILNTDVHAGFTSRLDGTDDWHDDDGDTNGNGALKYFDGTVPTTVQEEDIAGADIQYLTSVAVDHKHNAEVWVESQDYTYGQQVIDSNDPVYDPDEDSDVYPYLEFRGRIWDEVRTQKGGQLRFDFTSAVIDYVFPAEGSSSPPDPTNNELGNMISLVGIHPEEGDASEDVGKTISYTYCFTQDHGDSGDSITTLHEAYDVRGMLVAVKKDLSSEPRLANGWADAAALAAAINVRHYATVGNDSIFALHATANQVSIEDTSEYPGRVIIQQIYGEYGEQTNTSVWVNDYTDTEEDDDPITYNLNLHTKSSIDNTFSGGRDPSIHDIFAPTWDGADGGAPDYWLDIAGGDIERNQIRLRYGIWEVKTYLPAEEIPGPTNKLLSESEENPRGSILPPHLDLKRWKRVEIEEGDTELVDVAGNACNVHVSSYIPVEEYVYPVSLSAYLGQSVTRFSDLRFPPDATDLIAHNGIGKDPWAGGGEPNENALTVLYPDDDPAGHPGRGKIYYLSQAYLNNTPGWYRVIKKDIPPYLKKIRTPGKRTVLDKRRMPQMLYVDNEGDYNLRPIDWDPRESGDEDSNRGPGIFFDPSTEKPKESKINSMAFYRDRLFLANDDTIIASRSGNWDNFFLADPDNITDTDPLDLMVSSNNYTPITQLVPFRDTLFVGTSGNTQYELQGSNNIISPATAEFAPTAFYPMLPDISPLLLNNSLFFYSKEKLYVYIGQRTVAAEQAFELSKHIPQYLPKEIRDTTTSSHASSIFALDNEFTDTTIYVYRNQIAGEKVIQNAFYKYRIGQSLEIQPYLDLGIDGQTSAGIDRIRKGDEKLMFLQCWDKYLYLISLHSLHIEHQNTAEAPIERCLSLRRVSLDEEPINIPRLDNLRTIYNYPLPVHDPDTNRTTIRVPWSAAKADTIVTEEGTYNDVIDEGGDIIRLKYEGQEVLEKGNSGEGDINAIYDFYSIAGDQVSSGYYQLFRYIGNTFVSTTTLSPVYLRDEMNNLVPGTLNLRYGTIQTYNSRAFDVEVSVNNRAQTTYNFDHEISDDRWVDDYIGKTTLSGDISEHQVRFPILGFTEDVKITIISSNPHPLNVASLQFSGKFKGITRFHNS